MAQYEPVYRMTVYAPKSVDATEVTVLTPRAGAAHSDPFQVSTLELGAGWKNIMEPPRGRRGRIDPVGRRTDTGQLTVKLLDARTGTTNLERWVTAFKGDATGSPLPEGCKAVVEESLNGGSSWATLFTGRVSRTGLADSRLWFNLTIRDELDLLKTQVFAGVPHTGASYASHAPIYPNGLISNWGGIYSIGLIPATVQLLTDYAGRDAYNLRIREDEIELGGEGSVKTIMNEALFSLLYQMGTEDGAVREARVRIRKADLSEIECYIRAEYTWPDGLGTLPDDGGDVGTEVWTDGEGTGTGRTYGKAFPVLSVDSDDPMFGTMLDATNVDFYVYATERNERSPLLIADVHPVTLLKDLLRGYFGAKNTDGTVRLAIPFDATSFAALEADPSFEKFRGKITKAMPMADFIEKHLLPVHGLGIYPNASGEIVVVDMRPPTPGVLTGITTIQSSDLLEGARPTWERDVTQAITRVSVKHYQDWQVSSQEYIGDSILKGAPNRLKEQQLEDVRIHGGRYYQDFGDRVLKLDAIGLRGVVGEGGEGDFNKLSRTRRAVTRLAWDYWSVLGAGPAYVGLQVTRSSGIDHWPGDWVKVDVDALPDEASVVRGGARLMRVVERSESGPSITYRLLDGGEATVAVSPTIGVLAAGDTPKHVIDVPVTVNASGDPVRLEMAILAGATPPAEDSALWTPALMAYATGTVSPSGIPSGSRVWVRGRSEPVQGDGAKIPSAWVFSTGTDYIDTSGLSNVGAVSVVGGSLTSNSVELEWTLTALRRPIVIEYRTGGAGSYQLHTVLPAGSTRYEWTGLEVGVLYEARLYHQDPAGGISSTKSTVSFTPAGGNATAPDILGFYVIPGA